MLVGICTKEVIHVGFCKSLLVVTRRDTGNSG